MEPLNSIKKNDNEIINNQTSYPFTDLKYICQSTNLIATSIQQGFDTAQFPNGDIMVTEIKICYSYYLWDEKKQKFLKRKN
jgi:hypothetical protein